MVVYNKIMFIHNKQNQQGSIATLYSDLQARKETADPASTGSFLKFTVSKPPSTSLTVCNVTNFSCIPGKQAMYK